MCTTEEIKNSEEFLAIKRMYGDIKENLNEIDKLLPNNPALVSFRNEYIDLTRRILLISAANSFERHLCRFIPNIFCSSNHDIIYHFISKQALSRKYHTLFQWEQDKTNKKANSFYSLFGDKFKNEIRQKIDSEENLKLKEGESDFITLGNERNQVAHKGVKFAEFTRDIEGVYNLYNSSLTFYTFLCSTLIKERKRPNVYLSD